MKIFALLVFVSFAGLAQNTYNLIPLPKEVVPQTGQFVVKKSTAIGYSHADFAPVANLLQEYLQGSSGYPIPTKSAKSSSIQFSQNNSLGEEAYTLSIHSSKISIQAKTGKGAFYALQTLLQLMPAQVYAGTKMQETISIPNVQIKDEPRFSYRGLMLDVGRYYYPVASVKRFIDLMAVYKMNTFHWHLTEDQGWRIEIKKYPLLTSISSVRKQSMLGHYKDQQYDGKPHGGFYTQEEVKDIVAYAAKKYIEVIPEIEMPGHSQAVLAAYPQFGANADKIYQVKTKWGVSAVSYTHLTLPTKRIV